MSNSEINKNRNNKKPGEVKKDHAVDIKFLAMDLPRIFASMSYGLIYRPRKVYISNKRPNKKSGALVVSNHSSFTDPVIIGLPVIEGPGNVLNLRKGFAMGSDCANKDAAWQFIRSGILSSAQNSSWPFPSNQNAFENALAMAGEQAELVRLILSHAAPNAENDLIYNLVLENAADYFAGNGNSGEAAQRVQDAVVSYLATIKS